jgi:hypothetical protein
VGRWVLAYLDIFLLLLLELSVISVAPVSTIFWTTIAIMRETIKDLYDDRANLFYSVTPETIIPA